MSSSTTSRSDDGVRKVGTKRIERACDSCYSRKIKCDGMTPQCNWCQHHNIPCTFRRAVRKPKKQRRQFPGESRLNERVERIEKLLVDRLPTNQNLNKDDDNTATNSRAGTASPSCGPRFGKLHFAGLRLGDVSSCNGVPLFSSEGLKWVESRTGQNVGLEKLCSFGIPWQSHKPPRPDLLLPELATSGTVELPDINLVREYVSIFSCSGLRLVFPFIDPILFKETLKRAYAPSAAHEHRSTSAKACVCSFLAVTGIFSLREETAPSIDSEAYAWKAQCLLPQISHETTLDGLQTTLMLIIFHMLSGNLQPAIFVNTLSAGFTFMLGAHARAPDYCPRTASSPPDGHQRLDRHLRNLFWVNYTLDKELALRTRQPPAINDDHCDLTLPPEYGKHLNPDYRPSRDPDALPECHFPGDLRLSMIKSRAYNSLYSVRALQKSDAELIKAIRETDNELETWRLSLPLKYRPTISFCHENPPVNSDLDMDSAVLRLEYHHCMAIIHQAIGRCSAWASHQSGVMEGISSSLALSVDASRSSLSYLQMAHHVLADDCFWLVLFYPMSAVLTLFCNTLHNPLEPTATGDLELLSRVPALIRGLPIRHCTTNEVMHMKHIDDFVAELSRLARCAIKNACESRPMY